MATKKHRVAVGVFSSHDRAQQAVNELRRMGFREDQIGVAGKHTEDITGASSVEDTAKKSGAGLATGVATGAGLGALWGLGIVAGVLPAIGPAIAGGTLATILSSAGAGAAALGIVGALTGLGLSSDEATYYENEFKSGRIVVTVTADNRYDEAVSTLRRFGSYDMTNRTADTSAMNATSTSGTGTRQAAACATGSGAAGAGQKIQVKEEEMHVHKQPVQTGEVRVRKEVHTEHKTVEVPVKKEEVVIERRAVSGGKASSTGIDAGQEVRIPVSEEQVHIEKTPVVKEEVTVGKRTVTDTERVSGTVRKEELKVEQKGNVDVRGDKKSR